MTEDLAKVVDAQCLLSGLIIRNLATLGVSPLHINFRISLLVPTELLIDIFVRIMINLMIKLEET